MKEGLNKMESSKRKVEKKKSKKGNNEGRQD